MSIKVEKLKKVDHKKTRGFADINIGGLIVKGYRIVDGDEGLFVSEPSQPGEDNNWYKTVYTRDDSLRDEISKAILDEFNSAE